MFGWQENREKDMFQCRIDSQNLEKEKKKEEEEEKKQSSYRNQQ